MHLKFVDVKKIDFILNKVKASQKRSEAELRGNRQPCACPRSPLEQAQDKMI